MYIIKKSMSSDILEIILSKNSFKQKWDRIIELMMK